MQAQLHKIIQLLLNKSQTSSRNGGLGTGETGIVEIVIGNIKFPMETKEQLDELEHKLHEQGVMTFLVR